jgi:hypothetical protein
MQLSLGHDYVEHEQKNGRGEEKLNKYKEVAEKEERL